MGKQPYLQERIRYAVMAAISVLAIVAGVTRLKAPASSAAQAPSEAQVTAKLQNS